MAKIEQTIWSHFLLPSPAKEGGDVVRGGLSISVTRFGKISPLGQKIKTTSANVKGYDKYLAKFRTHFGKFLMLLGKFSKL